MSGKWRVIPYTLSCGHGGAGYGDERSIRPGLWRHCGRCPDGAHGKRIVVTDVVKSTQQEDA